MYEIAEVIMWITLGFLLLAHTIKPRKVKDDV